MTGSLYGSRKGRRGYVSIEENMDAPMRRIKHYVKKCNRRLITAARNSNDKTMITKKQKWEEKQLYGYFVARNLKSHT